MPDTIRLEVAASPTSLRVVRMIIGGVGARLDLSLDELEDLYVAVEELFRAGAGLGEGPRYTLQLELGDGSITVTTGPFRSDDLRARLSAAPPDAARLDISTVFAQVVQSVAICGLDEGCYSVAFTKQRGAV